MCIKNSAHVCFPVFDPVVLKCMVQEEWKMVNVEKFVSQGKEDFVDRCDSESDCKFLMALVQYCMLKVQHYPGYNADTRYN